MAAFSSVTSLMGGLRTNYALALAAYDDAGGKIAQLISQVTALQTNVALLQIAAASANASAATFSSLSGVAFTTYATITNFLST
jgi:hypothetical protein